MIQISKLLGPNVSKDFTKAITICGQDIEVVDLAAAIEAERIARDERWRKWLARKERECNSSSES